jgi:NADPH:quinone reductase-like Zn-dependent oxidoreductase
MKAAIVDQFGALPRYGDTNAPTAESTAQVAAASLKNLDRGLVSGRHYGSSSLSVPFIPGVDGVARLGDGTLVYANAVGGAGFMAEQTLVDPGRAVPLPDGLDPVLAAAIPNPGLSAWMSLEVAARIRPGNTVLVLGATGVTGAVAVQLAKHTFGAARVVAAGRNTERLQWLRHNGADDVIALGTEDLRDRVGDEHARQPFDIVLDYLWGGPAEQVLAALGGTGMQSGFHATRFLQIGSMAGAELTLPADILRSAGIEILGFGIGSVPADAQARVTTEILPALFTMGAEGSLRIDAQARPLADVAQVWNAGEPSGTRLVLVP